MKRPDLLKLKELATLKKRVEASAYQKCMMQKRDFESRADQLRTKVFDLDTDNEQESSSQNLNAIQKYRQFLMRQANECADAVNALEEPVQDARMKAENALNKEISVDRALSDAEIADRAHRNAKEEELREESLRSTTGSQASRQFDEPGFSLQAQVRGSSQ